MINMFYIKIEYDFNKRLKKTYINIKKYRWWVIYQRKLFNTIVKSEN